GTALGRTGVLVGKVHRGATLPQAGGGVPGARAVLDVVELADRIEQIAVGDRRHFAEAMQALAVADGAGNGLAVATGRHQRLTLLDRARRHVVIEADTRVAGFRCLLVLRQRDDAHAARFHARVRPLDGETHGAAADKALRHLRGFDHLDVTLARLDLREIIAGFLHVRVRHAARDRDHDGRAAADAT